MGVWVVFQSRRSREKLRPVKAELRASQSSLFSLLVMRQLADLPSSFFRVSLIESWIEGILSGSRILRGIFQALAQAG